MKTKALKVGGTFLLLVIVAFVAQVGCSGEEKSGAEGGQTVRLAYFANLTHAQAVLGVSSGDFEKAISPAKLDSRVFNAGPEVVQALFAGEIDLAYIGPGPALSAYTQSKGQGVRVISGSAANGVLIVASKESGITSLQDLAGKTVATPQHANTQDIAARYYLKNTLKADLKAVTPTPNAQQAGLMARGQLDASWAPEPWGSVLIAQTGAKLIAEEKDLWPEKQFSTTVIITTPEFLQKNPELVRKFLGAHQEWTTRLTSDPKKYTPQLAEALYGLTKKKLPDGVLDSALRYTQFTNDPLPHTFSTFAEWSYDVGVVKEKVDVKDLIDTSATPAGAQ